MTTGERIRYFRKARKVSQEALSLTVNGSRTQIALLETNHSPRLSLIRADRIAAALNVPLDALVDRPDNDPAQYLVAAGEDRPKLKAC